MRAQLEVEVGRGNLVIIVVSHHTFFLILKITEGINFFNYYYSMFMVL